MIRVLIVDDDPAELRHMAALAAALGYDVLTASGGEAALALLRGEPTVAVVLLDLVMPDRDGMAVLEALARGPFAPPTIVAATLPSPETITSLRRAGAVDFIDKPATPARLAMALANAVERRELEQALRSARQRRDGRLAPGDLVATSPAMTRALALAVRAARSPQPTLLEGEPGTGKTEVARLIHGLGERAGKPFVEVDCGALPDAALDALLFGSRRADPVPTGFAAANGGTLLLREVGVLSAPLQEKLLRVIESGEILRPGGRPERMNVRVIASSGSRLLNLARAGSFREDLYYRLAVLPIYLPPLRQRPEDLAPLAARFARQAAAELGRGVAGITPEALALLAACDWPGNVGELENAVYRAVTLASSPWLDRLDFPQALAAVESRNAARQSARQMNAASAPVHIDEAIPRRQAEDGPANPDRFLTNGEVTPLARLERDLIAFAIRQHGGRMSRIARALGIGRSTLYRKLRDHGLDDYADADAA